MKKRISNKKRAIVSAVSALTLCAACVAPAYYGTDIFCGITASAENVYENSEGTILYKDDAEGETTEIKPMDT